MKAVEEMKRTGNFNRSQLAQYGIELSKSPERDEVQGSISPMGIEQDRMANTHTIGFGNRDMPLDRGEMKRNSQGFKGS